MKRNWRSLKKHTVHCTCSSIFLSNPILHPIPSIHLSRKKGKTPAPAKAKYLAPESRVFLFSSLFPSHLITFPAPAPCSFLPSSNSLYNNPEKKRFSPDTEQRAQVDLSVCLSVRALALLRSACTET